MPSCMQFDLLNSFPDIETLRQQQAQDGGR
jgi:hypothetical protein